MQTLETKTDEGRRAWLEERRKGIGSSDAAAIAGLSPWASPLHVYLDKIGELSSPDSKRMAWGRKLEDVVALAYSEETGNTALWPSAAILSHPNHPWMIASLDRMAIVEGEMRVLELKTSVHQDDFGTPGTDEIPDVYNIQVQHQMAVADLPRADLCVLFAFNEVKVYTVERNQKIISNLIEMESDFWAKVGRREPPDPDWHHPRTPELLKNMYGVFDLEIHLGEDGEYWARKYDEANRTIAQAADAKSEARSHLLDLMGPAAKGLLSSGITLTRRKVNRKGYMVDPVEYVDFRVRVPKELS